MGPELEPRSRCSLPAVMMRGGTSKGLFIRREHLPEMQEDWEPILVSAMGRDKRQIDGIGGATTVTSKIAVVSRSTRPDADVDYTFVQVVVGEGKIDTTGNCGNMAAGVGPFALDEGIIERTEGHTEREVRIFNTNTNKMLVSTIEVDLEGQFKEEGDYRIAGVEGSHSRIKISFVDPAGSMTGKLFPTGNRIDKVHVGIGELSALDEPLSVKATLIDAGNPWALVDSTSFSGRLSQASKLTQDFLIVLEAIRQKASIMFGLAKSMQEAALTRGTPKIAMIDRWQALEGNDAKTKVADIAVRGFSGGKLHPSFHISGAFCTGICVVVQGTVARGLRSGAGQDLSSTKSDYEITISHPGGLMDVSVDIAPEGKDGISVKSASLFRTTRRLFDGRVYYHC